MKSTDVHLRLQALLFGAIGLLAAATIYVFTLISQQQTALEQSSHYDVAFSAGQATNEFFRFSQRIADLELDDQPETRKAARLRFEILFGRHELLSSGNFLSFIDQVPESKLAVTTLSAVLAEIEPLMERLEDPGIVEKISARITVLEPLMISLVSSANNYGSALVAASQDRLISLHWLFSGITALLIATGVLLVLLLMWSKRMIAQMHRDLVVSSRDLEAQSFNLQRQNMLFDAALNNMSQGLCMFGPEGNLIVANHRFGELFNLPQIDADGSVTCEDIAEQCRSSGVAAPDRLQSMFCRPIGAGGEGAVGRITEELRDGRVISISRQHIDDGGWVITLEDITTRHRAEERLAYLARIDTLTGLANRHKFYENLQQSIERLAETGEPSAVVCFNLDRFKIVNDNLGHRYGDLLLKAVADRARGLLREADFVARIGGDDFAVLLRGVSNSDRAKSFARKLIDALTEIHNVEGHKIIIGVSIGIAMVDKESVDVESTIRSASRALRRARSGGGNDYCVFDNGMDAGLAIRRSLERDLWNGFERGEFELSYQPQISFKDNRINGAEAVLSWRHPRRGLLPAEEFLSAAEDIGLIDPLGVWMLNRACTEAASWPLAVKVAVKLSLVQIVRGDIVANVSEALDATGLPPERLELELPEALLTEENPEVLDRLQQLRALKVGFALGNFRAGLSSLNDVRRFPIGKIKIDKSFVKDVVDDPEALAIVRAVTTLGEALDVSTTVEGVESTEQLQLLHLAGCNEGQGTLFSGPLKPAEMIELLNGPKSFKKIISRR